MSEKNGWKDVKIKVNKPKVNKSKTNEPDKSKSRSRPVVKCEQHSRDIKIVRKDQRVKIDDNPKEIINYNEWEPEYKHF